MVTVKEKKHVNVNVRKCCDSIFSTYMQMQSTDINQLGKIYQIHIQILIYLRIEHRLIHKQTLPAVVNTVSYFLCTPTGTVLFTLGFSSECFNFLKISLSLSSFHSQPAPACLFLRLVVSWGDRTTKQLPVPESIVGTASPFSGEITEALV